MDRFKDFVTENIYYHGTTPVIADHILKNGLDPSKSKYGNKLYLTTNHGEAHKYGKIANGNKPGVVLKVHKDNLDKNHILSDRSGIVEYSGAIDKDHVSKV